MFKIKNILFKSNIYFVRKRGCSFGYTNSSWKNCIVTTRWSKGKFFFLDYNFFDVYKFFLLKSEEFVVDNVFEGTNIEKDLMEVSLLTVNVYITAINILLYCHLYVYGNNIYIY